MESGKSHIIAAIVEHRPGVLHSVSNMFRRRGYNIESISIGPTEHSDLARMTIVVNGNDEMTEQVVKQLKKLIDVVKVSQMNPEEVIAREMALVKVNVPDAKAGADIVYYMEVFGGHVVDVTSESLTMELTGESKRIDDFIDLMKAFGIKELARTGVTALSREGKYVGAEG